MSNTPYQDGHDNLPYRGGDVQEYERGRTDWLKGRNSWTVNPPPRQLSPAELEHRGQLGAGFVGLFLVCALVSVAILVAPIAIAAAATALFLMLVARMLPPYRVPDFGYTMRWALGGLLAYAMTAMVIGTAIEWRLGEAPQIGALERLMIEGYRSGVQAVELIARFVLLVPSHWSIPAWVPTLVPQPANWGIRAAGTFVVHAPCIIAMAWCFRRPLEAQLHGRWSLLGAIGVVLVVFGVAIPATIVAMRLLIEHARLVTPPPWVGWGELLVRAACGVVAITILGALLFTLFVRVFGLAPRHNLAAIARTGAIGMLSFGASVAVLLLLYRDADPLFTWTSAGLALLGPSRADSTPILLPPLASTLRGAAILAAAPLLLGAAVTTTELDLATRDTRSNRRQFVGILATFVITAALTSIATLIGLLHR